MKVTRIAILVLLAAAGCRFAVSQKEVAARRLTQLLLTPIVAMQSGQPVSRPATRQAQPLPPVTAPQQAAAGPDVLPPQPLSGTPARAFAATPATATDGATNPQWRAGASTLCPQMLAARTTTMMRAGTIATQSGGKTETVWFRLAVPATPECERAKLSGS